MQVYFCLDTSATSSVVSLPTLLPSCRPSSTWELALSFISMVQILQYLPRVKCKLLTMQHKTILDFPLNHHTQGMNGIISSLSNIPLFLTSRPLQLLLLLFRKLFPYLPPRSHDWIILIIQGTTQISLRDIFAFRKINPLAIL